MDVAVVLGVGLSAIILVGAVVTALWPEQDEWEFPKPWLPPRELTEDDRVWLAENLSLTRDDN